MDAFAGIIDTGSNGNKGKYCSEMRKGPVCGKDCSPDDGGGHRRRGDPKEWHRERKTLLTCREPGYRTQQDIKWS